MQEARVDTYQSRWGILGGKYYRSRCGSEGDQLEEARGYEGRVEGDIR